MERRLTSRRPSKGSRKAKRTYNPYRKGGRKGSKTRTTLRSEFDLSLDTDGDGLVEPWELQTHQAHLTGVAHEQTFESESRTMTIRRWYSYEGPLDYYEGDFWAFKTKQMSDFITSSRVPNEFKEVAEELTHVSVGVLPNLENWETILVYDGLPDNRLMQNWVEYLVGEEVMRVPPTEGDSGVMKFVKVIEDDHDYFYNHEIDLDFIDPLPSKNSNELEADITLTMANGDLWKAFPVKFTKAGNRFGAEVLGAENKAYSKVYIGDKYVPYEPHYRICPADRCLRVLNKNSKYCSYHTTWGPGEESLVFEAPKGMKMTSSDIRDKASTILQEVGGWLWMNEITSRINADLPARKKVNSRAVTIALGANQGGKNGFYVTQDGKVYYYGDEDRAAFIRSVI